MIHTHRMPCVVVVLLAATATAAATGRQGSWDFAVGRRPYINETVGHLLLRTEGHAGQSLTVTASLCTGTLGNWSWNVTGGVDQLLSFPLAEMPHLVNNDIVVTLTHGVNSSSIRRRFQRAFKSNLSNTVQVDHHTSGLRVDGALWAGWGWYQYAYTSFVPADCDPSKIPKTPAGAAKNLQCMTWGIRNETAAMGKMAERGINLMMPYSFSPFARHGMTSDLPGGHAGATATREHLVLSYFDEAARHGAKVLMDCAGLYIDQGEKAWNNETLKMLIESVALVKDHPALLGYYTCDDCGSNEQAAQVRNTIFKLDPWHITAGATFSASAKFTDSTLSRDATSDDAVAVLPELQPTGELTPCDGGHPWGANCSKVAAAQPHTTLLLDLLMVENYSPSPDEHADHDYGALREEVPWEPVVNCDGSYTMEEHITRHKPPSILLTNMWTSTVVANTVSQLVFANSEPTPMEGGPPLAIGDKASQWGSKTSWMLFDQVEVFSAEARVLLPSLSKPFGLPQPTVTLTNVTELHPTQKDMPSGHHFVARAWRQHDVVSRNRTNYCAHLVVVSGAEQTPAMFTVQLNGSFPKATKANGLQWATRLFAADYKVEIDNGAFSDWIDAAGHNVYQLGC